MENTSLEKLTNKENILLGLVALLFVTFYFPIMPVVCNVVIGAIVFFSFFYNSWGEKWKLVKNRKAVIFMIVFYLLNVASAFLSVNRHEAFTMLGMRVPLLLFPLALGTIYIRPKLANRMLVVIAIINTVAAVICMGWALYQWRLTGNTAVLYNDSLSIAVGKQSIYFAMLVTLTIYFYMYLLMNKDSGYASNKWMYVAIIFLLLVHFMLASRINIIILYSSILLFAFYYIVRFKKVLEGVTLVMGLLIGSFLLIKFFPKTLNRFKELTYTKYDFKSQAAESHYNMEVTADQWNGANIRLAVWRCAENLIKQHPVLGVQIGDKQDQLVAEYQRNNFTFGIASRRNTHNNYIDVMLTFGIVGFILFMLGFIIFPFIQAFQNKFFLGCIIIAVLAIVMFSETYIDKSIGNIMLGFLVSFVIAACWPKRLEIA